MPLESIRCSPRMGSQPQLDGHDKIKRQCRRQWLNGIERAQSMEASSKNRTERRGPAQPVEWR